MAIRLNGRRNTMTKRLHVGRPEELLLGVFSCPAGDIADLSRKLTSNDAAPGTGVLGVLRPCGSGVSRLKRVATVTVFQSEGLALFSFLQPIDGMLSEVYAAYVKGSRFLRMQRNWERLQDTKE